MKRLGKDISIWGLHRVSMNWIIGIGIGVLVGYLLDREIYFYEGVHLGPRVQAWLYDRWSKKYDEGKRASQLHDAEMLARPLMDLLKDVPEPFILDFATGTGRLSYALLSQPEFKRHIIALDLSQGTSFQQKVWKTLQRISYGRLRSYQWVAVRVGGSRYARAVGNAVGSNPLPIVIPCHRIVAQDKSLGGFSGGLPTKRKLLTLEGTLTRLRHGHS